MLGSGRGRAKDKAAARRAGDDGEWISAPGRGTAVPAKSLIPRRGHHPCRENFLFTTGSPAFCFGDIAPGRDSDGKVPVWTEHVL